LVDLLINANACETMVSIPGEPGQVGDTGWTGSPGLTGRVRMGTFNCLLRPLDVCRYTYIFYFCFSNNTLISESAERSSVKVYKMLLLQGRTRKTQILSPPYHNFYKNQKVHIWLLIFIPAAFKALWF